MPLELWLGLYYTTIPPQYVIIENTPAPLRKDKLDLGTVMRSSPSLTVPQSLSLSAASSCSVLSSGSSLFRRREIASLLTVPSSTHSVRAFSPLICQSGSRYQDLVCQCGAGSVALCCLNSVPGSKTCCFYFATLLNSSVYKSLFCFSSSLLNA